MQELGISVLGCISVVGFGFMYVRLKPPQAGDKVIYTDAVDSHIATYISKLPHNKCEIIIENMYLIVDTKNIIKI